MEDATDSASKPAPWESGPRMRYFLVFLLVIQILFMILYWAVYCIYLVAGAVFAPGRSHELTTFGTLLTAFAVASIGATCYEIPLLFSNRRAEMKLWLVLRVVLNGLWTALPIIYLVWLINNPYLVPYTLEVVGMVAVCFVFQATLLWNAVELYHACFGWNKPVRELGETAPLLDEVRSRTIH